MSVTDAATLRKRAARKRRRERRKARATSEVRKGLQVAGSKVQSAVVVAGGVGSTITRLLMTPGESPLVRMPTPGYPKVALAKMRSTESFEEVPSVANYESFGNYTYVAILIGQPSLAYMDGPFVYQQATQALLFFNEPGTDGAAGTNRYLNWHLRLDEGQRTSVWWPLVSMEHTGETALRRRPILRRDGIPLIWLNTRERLVVKAGSGYNTGQAKFSVYHCGTEEMQMTCYVTETLNWDNQGSPEVLLTGSQLAGWYAVKLDNVYEDVSGDKAMVAFNVSVQGVQGESYWKLHYMQDLVSTATTMQSTRRTACSLLVSNRSSSMIAQGDVNGVRIMNPLHLLQGGQLWPRLEQAAERYNGHARDGCYTYLEFNESDEQFRDYLNDWGQPIAYPEQMDMLNVVAVKNGSSNQNTYAVICDMVVEFMTDSQLYNTSVSLGSFQEMAEARRISHMTSYFYENHMHWSDIERYIKRMWDWTRKHSLVLGTAASAIFPEASSLIMPTARMLQS